PSARGFLLREGTDSKFGARHLKRAIERHLLFPISNLLATGQIELGDRITVDYDPQGSRLTFSKEDWGLLLSTSGERTRTQQRPLASISRVGTGVSETLARRATERLAS